MITEDYVSFETAKLLQEKGFDKYPLFPCYRDDDSKLFIDIPTTLDTTNWHFIPAPTLQMAMKWLREVHNCHICVQSLITTDGLQGYCPFYTKVEDVFMWQNVLGDDYTTASTYEEACEAAIKYCLENLI